MTDVQKNIILLNCNSSELSTEDIQKIIESGEITIEEFRSAGLSQNKIFELEEIEKRKKEIEEEERNVEEDENQRSINLERIIGGKIYAEEIRSLINRNAITFDDILNSGIPSKIVNALKYYCSTEKITKSYTVDDLPPMEEGRTDVYFVGLPGSGKSTMIAGLLNVAQKSGLLLPDPYHAAGVTFQTNLIQDLSRGVLPERTMSGSYNYIAASLKDSHNNRHPLNIVDVPGELYNSIQDNAEVNKFLRYINNKNKKILIFVIDSLEHENDNSVSNYDQSVVFPNILQMFNKSGVLEQTDAIYLVVNKFDAIKESKYYFDDRPNGDIALEFINDEFLGLKNNCFSVREDAKNDIKIKVIPFSIGSLSYGSILNTLDKDFAKTILNQITKDSFIISGGVNRIFK
jgi:GTP-binding protein EngB required for normal cell division